MIAQVTHSTQSTRPAPATPATAAEWAARIVARHPALARPVADALALVEAGHVSGNDGHHATCRSSDGTAAYDLRYTPATGVWHCNCPAYAYRPYRIGPVAYCKHTLARAIAARVGVVAEPAPVVCAVHAERLSEGRRRYYATVAGRGGHERPVEISQRAYDALIDQAADDDYRDGSYTAFNRPIEWADVFAEDRTS